MSLDTQRMPTLGYFNKIICDSLGLWSSDPKDISFNVPANEEERKKALQDAFCAIKNDNGSYGTISELISVTTETAPGHQEIVRKNKTIQSHINYFSKEDFASYHELMDFKGYIKIVIEDVYKSPELSSFAYKIYESALMYYREFIREHAAKPGKHLDSYIFFVKSTLIDLIGSLAKEFSIDKNHLFHRANPKPNDWPLRTFVDSVTELCGVSLHRLHQFHDFKLNHRTYSDKEIWGEDLTSQSINTRSKQIVGRLNKNNKIKWNGFYPIIEPLLQLLPEGFSEEFFEVKAYSSFVLHNINRHIRELSSKGIFSETDVSNWHYPRLDTDNCHIPVSDRVDQSINHGEFIDGEKIQASIHSYHEFVKNLRLLSYSLIGSFKTPSTLEFLYNRNSIDHPIKDILDVSDEVPLWVYEWNEAKMAVLSRDVASALYHYKISLKSAKYSAGPLFIALYTEICAFCKHQYKQLKNNNEEHLFERFYEPLGDDASKYAILIGYAPGTLRNAKTLMPTSTLPKKDALLIFKIDSKMKEMA
ncbi:MULTISPECIES: hypothetical protein [unclassified Marinobacter]|uniref:hypothetical protein n=1 Tax=unclassified Marinobacter TaxID=83889 RepID=UPI0012A8680B|nr:MULTISPECIES: hypothetical protein [unclassified Marinobacter]QFS88958.1 hypothetical protein FIV08_19115 [Marinobacter sp. THAF197a]QFT52743.1 hypothetical protein FIU96_19020 [Marinobacter sp. THAF39]